jgi:hypothetical protein
VNNIDVRELDIFKFKFIHFVESKTTTWRPLENFYLEMSINDKSSELGI